MTPDVARARLDKWLWAARFFKTRAIAADAVASGKVLVDGGRAKPAKEVKPGQVLCIRCEETMLEVRVRGIASRRTAAPEAALLYQETEESRQRRDDAKATGEAGHARRERGSGRPTKRQLRDIRKFTGGW